MTDSVSRILYRFRLLPLAGFSRAENCFDHGHVADRILKRHGHFSVLKNGSGEGVTLQRVLIRRGETLHGDAAEGKVAGRVDEEPRGPVVGRVERNLKLDAAF